ncbi:TIGR00270 family protein [Candidatus Woesearchaeota archaeon]|nr:TIGR00270 family protein [Candidatus Woesearchaeota archaeon]
MAINCDLCGKRVEILAKAVIEGVQLDVCSDCARFGKVVQQPKRLDAKSQIRQMQKSPQKEEKMELLVENYAEIIRKRRESMGLTQKDFAGKISEKEATVHKIETGALAPPLSLAKKLERFLGVRLVEEYEESHETPKGREINGFTLGDFINVRK